MICAHGPLDCQKCFEGNEADKRAIEEQGFRLVNDPGYWGATDPVVLVLGQTKGRNQWQAFDRGSFDGIAFAGIRGRLHKVLSRIGVVEDADNFETRFTAAERDFGFASLLRCSLSTLDGRSSGSPIVPAMKTTAGAQWVRTCFERWLIKPNPRLRLVVFLGIADAYIQAVLALVKELHPESYRLLGDYAATTGSISWIFAQHPSGVSENHYRRWIGDEPLEKRDTAIQMVRGNLERPVILSSLRKEGTAKQVTTATADASVSSRPFTRSKPVRKSAQVGTMDSVDSALRQAIQSRLASSSGIARHGYLKQDNKKMSDWHTESGRVFAHEYGNKLADHLWVQDTEAIRSLGIEMRPYPSAAIGKRDSPSGAPVYGRHSALKTIPEFRNADLIRLTPSTMSEVERILTALRDELE